MRITDGLQAVPVGKQNASGLNQQKSGQINEPTSSHIIYVPDKQYNGETTTSYNQRSVKNRGHYFVDRESAS